MKRVIVIVVLIVATTSLILGSLSVTPRHKPASLFETFVVPGSLRVISKSKIQVSIDVKNLTSTKSSATCWMRVRVRSDVYRGVIGSVGFINTMLDSDRRGTVSEFPGVDIPVALYLGNEIVPSDVITTCT
jgi:hypothetical protein